MNYSKQSQYINALILYIIAFLYVNLSTKLNNCKESSWCNIIHKLNTSCIMLCEKELCNLIKARGDNYFVFPIGEEIHTVVTGCLVTFWSATHFLLYFFLGIFATDLFWQTFIIGVIFEFGEYYMFQCHDPMDIVWNTLGFITGQYIARNYFS